MGNRQRLAQSALLLACLAGMFIQAGCGVGAPTIVRVSGKILGENIAEIKAGNAKALPVHAQVACNNVTAQTAADGSYHLEVGASAKPYTCHITAATYQPLTTTFSASAGAAITLNAASSTFIVECYNQDAAHINCSYLHYQTGSIHGTAMISGRPLARAAVTCNPTHEASENAGATANTDASGVFTIAKVSVDTYICSVTTQQHTGAAQTIFVGPGSKANVTLSVCARGCPYVHYYGGAVMHTMTAYLIFWLPTGYHFEPQGSDSHYETIMEQYFQDVGGTAFYTILTQYWDGTGFVQNSATLGGYTVDTTPYFHKGTIADPVLDSDIQIEIGDTVTRKNWPQTPDTEVFVFTAAGVQTCVRKGQECSYYINNQAACGYHSYIWGSQKTPYALITDPATISCLGGANYGKTSPHGDWTADEAASTVSHEQFEAVSDPDVNAWIVDVQTYSEIGDLCVLDTGYVTLNHGHTYYLQGEWSNAAGGCVFR